MSGIYTAILVLSSVLAIGTALKCYGCRSLISWDDCMQNSIKANCSDRFLTKCGKLEATVKNTTTGKTLGHFYFAVGCIKTCNTHDYEICLDSRVTCTIRCCSGDYCNAGSSLVASIINPALCALILLAVY